MNQGNPERFGNPVPRDTTSAERTTCEHCGKQVIPLIPHPCVGPASPVRDPAPPDFKGVDQTEDGCWFACIASLTGIPLGDFPPPPADESGASDVHNAVTKLLHGHGWQMHRLWTIPDAVPRGWAIAGGTSPRNRMHSVVVYDGVMVWDPHPSRAGLVAIEEYEILVPVRAGNALPVRGVRDPSPPELKCPNCDGVVSPTGHACAGRPRASRDTICGAIVGIRGFDGQCTRRPAHRGAHFDSRYDVMDREDTEEVRAV